MAAAEAAASQDWTLWLNLVGVFAGAVLGAFFSVWWSNRAHDRREAVQAFLRVQHTMFGMYQKLTLPNRPGNLEEFNEWSRDTLALTMDVSLIYEYSRRWTFRRIRVRKACREVGAVISEHLTWADPDWNAVLKPVGRLKRAMVGDKLDRLFPVREPSVPPKE